MRRGHRHLGGQLGEVRRAAEFVRNKIRSIVTDDASYHSLASSFFASSFSTSVAFSGAMPPPRAASIRWVSIYGFAFFAGRPLPTPVPECR